MEVEYKWLLIPDPAEYRLAKPSANAIPMPKSRKDRQSLNTSQRQADDNPRADDPFVENHTWSEFNTVNLSRNAAQAKINFQKENQIWHYLGRNSTEARAQFTEDLAKQRNNPKANFLDTVARAAPPPLPRHSYSNSYTNQQASSVSRVPQSRPLPPSTARPEKPYVYKPRSTGDTYRVDPQAYHSQQNFLQRSAPSVPYSFGTDPQYRADPTSHLQYSKPASTSPLAQPPISTSGQYSKPAAASPLAPPPVGPLAPPTHYRPPYQAAMPPKPSNPFSGRAPQTSRPKPNPFAKYPYLQKEHNRSPLEYKSPYRPGGGFMNGFQGNFGEHLQQTLFQKRPGPGSGSGPSNSNTKLYNSLRPQYSPGQQSASTSSSYAPPKATYASYGSTPTASRSQQPTSPQGVPAAAQNSWEKKDNSQLHPAIRQDYHQGSMFHQQYQPPRQPTPQYQASSVLQPPPMWNNSRPTYQPPPNQGYNQAPYPQASRPPPTMAQPQSYHSSPGPRYSPTHQPPQFQQPTAPKSQTTTPSYQSPQYQHSSPATQQPPANNTHTPSQLAQGQYRPPPGSYQTAQPLSSVAQQASHPPISNNRGPGQENKAMYAHQQYFQKPYSEPQASQLQPQMMQKYEPADVPVDSTSIIEKMMMNLKKAKDTHFAQANA